MENQFKVCGNCGNCTMVNDRFVCIDSSRSTQMPVRMGDRQPCFIVSPLTSRQAIAAALSPEVSSVCQ